MAGICCQKTNIQTNKEIAKRFSVSESTVKRKIRAVNQTFECKEFPCGGVLLKDTTCFGKNWGVGVFQDVLSGKKLWRKYVKNEKLIDYQYGIKFVQGGGYKIDGLVCDGLSGIFKQFLQFPTQMCQRHQIDIVRQYLS